MDKLLPKGMFQKMITTQMTNEITAKIFSTDYNINI